MKTVYDDFALGGNLIALGGNLWNQWVSYAIRNKKAGDDDLKAAAEAFFETILPEMQNFMEQKLRKCESAQNCQDDNHLRICLAKRLDACWCDDGGRSAECQRCLAIRELLNLLDRFEGFVPGASIVLDDGRSGTLCNPRGCQCGPHGEACWDISLSEGGGIQAHGGRFRLASGKSKEKA